MSSLNSNPKIQLRRTTYGIFISLSAPGYLLETAISASGLSNSRDPRALIANTTQLLFSAWEKDFGKLDEEWKDTVIATIMPH